MSIATIKTKIKQTLAGMTDPPRKIYTSPAEAVNLADFPCVVLALPDGQTMTFSNDSNGRSTHEYTIMVYVFVGTFALTQYNKLQELAEAWPDKLRAVLTPDNLKLIGSVVGANGEQDSLKATYTIGTLNEFDPNYYGIKVNIPIWERTQWG